jgi:polyisoprenoid-binding protein YceI
MSTTAQELKTVTGLPAAGTWELDKAHTSIEFVARHMMVTKVRGRFNDFDGRIHVAENPADSWAEATMSTSSIDTNMSMRDDHLRSPDFLHAEQHPDIKVRTTGGTYKGDGRWTVSADLTIREQTLPIELDAEFLGTTEGPMGEVAFFSATAEFDREDFGITWNKALESGGVLVGKKVKIEIQAEANRKDA